MARLPRPRKSAQPLYTAYDLGSELKAYSREPFLDTLQHFMEQMPDAETIAQWARTYPDRYVQALRSLAGLSGFTERTETDVNLTLSLAVRGLSDSQLEDQLRTVQGLIEARPVEENAQGESPNAQGESPEVSGAGPDRS